MYHYPSGGACSHQPFAYQGGYALLRAQAGQGLKVLALRYAQDVLRADMLHTHHDAKNPPAITIDRKLGYVQMQGTHVMEKMIK